MNVKFDDTAQVQKIHVKLYEPLWKVKTVVIYLKHHFEDSDVSILGYFDREEHSVIEFTYSGKEQIARARIEGALKTYKYEFE